MLISLGIFGIGMIAVASLFPVGAILQKQTADDILGTQSTHNARATIEAVGLTYAQGDNTTDLGMYHPDPNAPHRNIVIPADTFLPNGYGATTFYDRYPIRDRAYPTVEADPFARDHYWYFFVRDAAGNPASPSWQGFVYLVERDERQTLTDLESGFRYANPVTLTTPGDIEIGTPYITLDGKTGNWDPNNIPSFNLYYHPQGVGVETFVFETLP